MTDVVDRIKAVPSADAEEPAHPAAPESDLALLFPLVLQLPPDLKMSQDQFMAFCQENETLRIERNAAGGLEIMPPAGGETSNRNFGLTVTFGMWVEQV
jgi:hypothetical protein